MADNGQGTHTAIDPHEEHAYKSIGLLNIERANLNNLVSFFQSLHIKFCLILQTEVKNLILSLSMADTILIM